MTAEPARQPRRWSGRRSRRRFLIGAGAAVVVGAGAAVSHRFGHPVEHITYWWWRAHQEVPDGAPRVVLLGDSSMIGVGATSPSESLAGRAVALAESLAGSPAHVTSLASGGVSAREVLARQIPGADLGSADLVLASIGTADVASKRGLEAFTADAADLLDALPQPVTVLSDVLMVGGYEPYRDALGAAADERGIRRAHAAEAFLAAQRRDVMAPDGIHLSSLGHSIWFEAFTEPIADVLA